MSRYDYFSSYYDLLLSRVENSTLKKLRSRFVPLVRGKTLDVAVGTGNNIKFYPKGSNVVLIDNSQKMLEIAKSKAKSLESSSSLEFVHTAAESLPFEDETFDSILSIDVFCSIKTPDKVLKELHRVLKSEGQAYFIEHMRTGNFLKDAFLSLITIFTYLSVGSSMVRPVDDYINSSDFTVEKIQPLDGTFKFFSCKK